MYNIGFTSDEIDELILLIDDEEVDEEFLASIRKKLVHKRKMLRKKVKDYEDALSTAFEPKDFTTQNLRLRDIQAKARLVRQSQC